MTSRVEVLDEIQKGVELKQGLKQQADLIVAAAKDIAKALRSGGKILIFGNGGSAADAQHFAAELIGNYRGSDVSLPALALTTNASTLTAIANDYSYDEVFARQVKALCKSKDVVIAISSSGTSQNVIRGVISARKVGARTIALTGGSGGKLKARVDRSIIVPSTDTQRIQEAHIVIIHILCRLVATETQRRRRRR